MTATQASCTGTATTETLMKDHMRMPFARMRAAFVLAAGVAAFVAMPAAFAEPQGFLETLHPEGQRPARDASRQYVSTGELDPPQK